MSRQTATRFAWSLFAVSVVFSVVAIVLASIQQSKDLLFVVTVALVLAVPFPAIGALIASRFPRNAIGWIFCAIGLLQSINILSPTYARYALIAEPGSLPLGSFVGWLGYWAWMPSIGLLTTFLLLLFPHGRLPSRRWRWAAWLSGAGLALMVVGAAGGAATISTRELILTEGDPSGFPPLAGAIAAFGGVLVFGGAVASAASIFVRLRRSRGEERQQLKWMAYAGGYLFVATVLQFTPAAEQQGWAGLLLRGAFIVGILAVPVAAALAILKYRLYAIDVVVSKTVVYGVLAFFITAVYVAIVIGVGTLAGSRGSPFLSAVAAAVVAIAFQPVRRWAHRLANRLVYGQRSTPYEVLSGFSDRLAGAYSLDEVVPLMARVIVEGTGASQASVWLDSGTALRPVASWPPTDDVPAQAADLAALPDRAFEVRHQGEVLGAVTVAMPPNEPMTPAQEKLVDDLAAQAGLVLRNVRLVEDLRDSRRRIVAAQDQRAKKLERDIHDGAQQQLVALTVKARLARQLVERDAAKTGEMLAEIETETQGALEDLRDLARGIYPPLLADAGLAAALGAQARKSPLPVTIDAEATRYPQEVESAVYFCALEALQNVAKYAGATHAQVHLAGANGELSFEISDDGRGFDPGTAARGSGLQGMADRMEALGGELVVRSSPGAGTFVTGRVPTRGGSS